MQRKDQNPVMLNLFKRNRGHKKLSALILSKSCKIPSKAPTGEPKTKLLSFYS